MIEDSYYCNKCNGLHYEFGKIGQDHIEYTGKSMVKETKLVSPDEWLIRLSQLRGEISEAKKRLEVAEECLYSWIREIP